MGKVMSEVRARPTLGRGTTRELGAVRTSSQGVRGRDAVQAAVRVTVVRDTFAFFFSSRRRHTRFDCDWSSDVCSSDLTCTQYFFRSIDDLAQPGFEGAKYVYSPPARDAANHDVLWAAVRADALSAISTDHCAFLWDGQKTLGKDDFTKIPNGGPGPEDPRR